MSAAHEHRDGAECEHCESQPSALQRAFAAAVVFVAQPVVIRGIVVGGTLFCTLAWFQLPSVQTNLVIIFFFEKNDFSPC
jgi:hypothetical protein